MKKSIFLFFAAILCAMSVSAKVIYFKPNSNWAAANANFYAHVWGGEGATSPVKFTPVATDPDVYEAEVGTHTSIIFLRHDPAKTDDQVQSDMWNLWNRMGNLSIPTTGENCCTINDGEWSQEKDDASSHVTWSTYTPPTEVVIPDRYITGTLAGGWNANEVKMTYDEATETYSHTFTAVAADAEQKIKVTDGTWGKNWGGAAVSPAIDGITTDGDGNVCFTLSTAGDVTITFDGTNIQLTTTGSFKTFNTYDITVKAVVPEVWTSETISIHYWGDGVESPANPAPTVKEGNWNFYTITGVPEGKSVSVIFLNGTAWTSDKTQQTVNLTDITGNICFQISAINKATDDENKCTATVVDCGATIEPEATPEPEPTELTYNVTVPAGTKACYIAMDTDPAQDGWEFNEMTKVDDTHYTITIEGAKTSDGYKYASGADWGYVEKDASGNEIGDRTYVDGNDVVARWASVYDPDAVEQELTYSVTVPEGTYACYIAMDTDPAQDGWEFNEMTKVDDTHYTFTRTGLKNKTYKYASGAGWEYVEKTAEDGEVADRTWAENDLVAKWASVYNPSAPTYDYYIAGTENLTGFNWSANGLGMEKDGDVYKHTFSELPAGEYEFKVTNGTWTDPWGYNNLSAAYEEVSEGEDEYGNPNGNIKFVTEEAKNITVIFDPATDKITIDGLTEKAPAEPVTVYFINSGEWAEVACYYWGGLNGSEWPGVQMDLTAETYEAEGWNVYKVTFPGDNTSCIFNDNKAEDVTQTGNLEVHDGQYYCYANGIWYERLADVDPLDTRVYLKGDMNEWCNNGWCDMFRKENVSETVAYITTWLEANTTYEFKIESAGAWLSNTGTMTKDNCTGWTFEESVNDNAKITTEYAGDYTFIWDMTTNKLSVEYPDPKANPTVLDLMVTNMVFDGEIMTFSGSDNTYGIALNLVVGDMIDEEVYALNASSTVEFGGTLFTDVTGTITPDMIQTIATAVVYGFFDGTYFQLNVDMSAGGGTLVEIWDGVATPNDGTGELTISANWDGDDVYVVVPGFDYTNYECPEVWFYIGGITWETADIAAFGPATITVEDGGVLVEGSVISGATGAQYELMVFGLLPVEETPDYTRPVTAGNFGTLCLPFGGEITGAVLYEVVGSEPGKVYLGSVTTLEAGVPYIFQATATELAVYSDGTNAPASDQNGLYGTFDDETVVDAGNYILLNNELRPSDGTAKVNANRAYLVMSEIPSGAPQQMPGRRYIGMSVQGENETTGVEDIFTTDTPVKLIENGQLIIIRNGEKFNAQGVRL